MLLRDIAAILIDQWKRQCETKQRNPGEIIALGEIMFQLLGLFCACKAL